MKLIARLEKDIFRNALFVQVDRVSAAPMAVKKRCEWSLKAESRGKDKRKKCHHIECDGMRTALEE
ncbi:hypothetical protein EGY12_15605 [Serratia sp. FDAARGOS_506]|nr:hypothetical protein EGY12_15605 [Serratia sp. FDAARGOS_506]